jgi:streptogramin lyase
MSATGQKGLYVNLNSGAVQASLLPFRNALMNGDMLVNRRGTSTNLASLTAVATATPGSFVTDRWNVYRAGFAAGASIGQGTDLTYADIPFSDVGIDSYGRIGRTVGNALTAAIYCDYNMESQDSYRFAGRQITLSFYYRNGVNFSDTALAATLYYATGIDQSLVTAFGSFTSFATQTFAKVGAWTRTTLTGLVPTTATQVALRFSYTPVGTAGGTDHFDLTGVQLETGSVATPFETRLGWTDIPTFSSQTNALQISGNLDVTGHNFAQVSSAPHVTFSTETSNVFLSWLQRTTTTLAGSWWQTPATPVYSTIASGTGYAGGVLVPDGRVVFVPYGVGTTGIGLFNPATNTYTTVGDLGSVNGKHVGGVLLPDGRVVFVPFSAATIAIFNPVTNTYSTTLNVGAASFKYNAGVLLPDGRVVFVPAYASAIGIFNPTTNTYSTVGVLPGGDAYAGGVLLPDGRVVFVPRSASTIGIFNPATDTYSTIGGMPGNNAYFGGVLLPDGRVLFVPWSATAIVLFNPITNTYSTIGGMPGNFAYYGGVLLPDGRVVFIPYNATTFGIFNPATNAYSTIAGPPGGNGSYGGGVILPDGRVVCVPLVTAIGILSGFPRPPPELCYHPCFNKL